MFPYFVVFGKTIGMYALCSGIGLILAAAFFALQVKRIGIKFEDVVLMVLVVLAGIMIGGHFLFGVTQFESLVVIFKHLGKLPFTDTVRLIVECFSGSVFYGGLIGSCLAGLIYLRIKKYSLQERQVCADTYACAIPLFHTFGRIGCFFGGCCYGIESKFGFTAHGNTYSPAVNDVNRFPVALLEASLDLILFFVLFAIYKKGKLKGNLIFTYGLAYSVIRFCTEFLRGDIIRGIWFGLSTSQWVSIVLFVVCVTKLIRLKFAKHNA